MVETTTNGKNGWWISTTNTTSTGIVTGSYVYPDSNMDSGTWFGNFNLSKETTPDEMFSMKKMIRTKDSELIEITYAEIYELKRMKKIPEEMTRDEITDVILVLRI